jgi:hypothetical protein
VAGVVHIPWYATGFRGDQLGEALNEIASVAMRYGATEYTVYRSRDDRYKFLQLAHFESKLDWDRYWEGPEFVDFRVRASSWFQVPALYTWHDRTAHGEMAAESGAGLESSAAANGH